MTPIGQRPVLEERLSLRPGVYKGRSRDGGAYLVGWPAAESMGSLSEGLDALLDLLSAGPTTSRELRRGLAGSSLDASDLGDLLSRLRAGGWLEVTVTAEGRPWYTLAPDRRPRTPPTDGAPDGLLLSRFVLMHREGTEIVAESPRAWCRLRVHEPSLLAEFGLLGLAPEDSPRRTSAVPEPVRRRLWSDLWWAGMLVRPEAEDGRAARQWGLHELWFHDRSRIGRRAPGEGFGATWWARGSFPPPPVRREPFGGPRISLFVPDLKTIRSNERPLSEVLESRRTIRHHDDDRPVTVDQLGELLFRTTRTRLTVSRDGFEYVGRPHPGGGGAGELEVYPVVRLADGLSPGMYHYDAHEHQLERVSPLDTTVARIVRMGAMAAGMKRRRPQVLLVVAARFGRLMWKYQEMPYATILKHVGVLYQMFYLVATAMRLAPCGLGAGDADAFAEATGADPLEESSVGEFMIGSRHAVPVPEDVP